MTVKRVTPAVKKVATEERTSQLDKMTRLLAFSVTKGESQPEKKKWPHSFEQFSLRG